MHLLNKPHVKKSLRKIFWPIVRVRKWLLHKLNENYIVSYPKSGRTWMNFFLASYYCKKYELPFRLNFLILLKGEHQVPRFHFTHAQYNEGGPELIHEYAQSLAGKKVLLLVRDPRDVLVSLYHHTQKRQLVLDSRGLSFSDFLRHPKLGIERCVDYMNIWLSYKATFASFAIIRYESIRSNPDREFRDVLTFLSPQPVDETVFAAAIHDSTFEVMKEKERQGVVASPKLQTPDAGDDNAYKVRKGKVGGYAEFFTDPADMRYVREHVDRLHKEFAYDYGEWGT